MNNQLIEKVIKSSNQICPEFTYTNPLLDKNIAKALSKSFVKILNHSKHNSNINNNLRLSILENIRKMCQITPENHLEVDENLTYLLVKVYESHIEETSSVNAIESINRRLDAYLVRKMKELNLSSNFDSTLNPEVVQALINLNDNGLYLETLSRDIIYWNVTTGKYMTVLKELWTGSHMLEMYKKSTLYDDISIKIKSEIERLLLDFCHEILLNRDTNIEDMFISKNEFKDLISKCVISPECYQICCGILNFIFIMTNFDSRIQSFLPIFVQYVKQTCSHITFSVLYPVHVSYIVVLLDFDINILPAPLKDQYIQPTLKYLHTLHTESEKDLILLLSHFPQWFDYYFDEQKLNN